LQETARKELRLAVTESAQIEPVTTADASTSLKQLLAGVEESNAVRLGHMVKPSEHAEGVSAALDVRIGQFIEDEMNRARIVPATAGEKGVLVYEISGVRGFSEDMALIQSFLASESLSASRQTKLVVTINPTAHTFAQAEAIRSALQSAELGDALEIGRYGVSTQRVLERVLEEMGLLSEKAIGISGMDRLLDLEDADLIRSISDKITRYVAGSVIYVGKTKVSSVRYDIQLGQFIDTLRAEFQGRDKIKQSA